MERIYKKIAQLIKLAEKQYIRAVLALFLVFVATSLGKAQTTVDIGTGTTTFGTANTYIGDVTPFGNRWPAFHMQLLYTAAELQAAGVTGNIGAIAFNVSQNGSATSNSNYTVKIGTTALTALTTTFQSTTGYTTVFPAATYTHAVGWNTITFSTPYTWDGSSNIIIDFEYGGADSTYNADSYYSTTTNNSVTAQHDGGSASVAKTRPNVRFTYTPNLPCAGTPSAGSISGTTVRPTCGGSTPSLSTVTVTGQTTSASGITFQWEKSTDNTTWVNATGTGNATATYTIPAHVAGQTEYYRLKATCTASALFAYSNVLQVTDPAAPTTQATNVGTSVIGNTTATITWTNGNGSRRFAKINTVNNFTDPVDGSGSALTSNATYSGSGEQIIYDGTGTSVNVIGLTPNTTYYVRVYEYMRCGSAEPYTFNYQTATGTNNPGNFTTSLYCTPTGAENNADEIRNFTLSNLNNSSAASEGVNGYSNYSTSVVAANLTIGTPYVASMTSGTGSMTHGAAIWIDYNDDGIFSTSEKVAFIGNTINPSTTVSFPAFTVPSTVATGTHRLRVMYIWGASGDAFIPCATTASSLPQYGEIEDYAVNVVSNNLATNEIAGINKGIKIYPNPFSDVLNISDVEKVKTIAVMDTSGKMVKSFDKATQSINLSGLNSGMYLVVLTMKDGSKQTIKAIKK